MVATPTLAPRQGEKEKKCIYTWKFLEVRLYSVAVYVLVLWGYILPNSNNHTRPILKLKDRLD